MIASALRAEIQRSGASLRQRYPLFAAPTAETSRSRLPGASGAALALLKVLERAPREHAVEHLVHRALFLHLAAENGPAFIGTLERRCGLPRDTLAYVSHARPECRDRMEEALDAIDVRVEDPMQLPALRDGLRGLTEQLERLCEEATRAGRTDDIHISAA